MKVLAGLIVSVIVLSACGSANTPAAATTAASAAPATAAPAATPGPPKVLTYVAIDAPSDLRLLNRQGANKPFTGPNGDELVYLNTTDGKLKPALATAWKQAAPDTWEFTLRAGVKFQDGSPFDAATAAWAIETQTTRDSPALAVRYGPTLKATAKDAMTVSVKCATACPLLDKAAPFWQFESKVYRDAHKTDNWSVGLGPYVLDKFTEGQSVHFTRYKDYWGKQGYYDEVNVVWRKEPSVRAPMLTTGE